jgi:hypothetical protein
LSVGLDWANLFSHMKVTDDYNAKYRLWAANPTAVPAAAVVKLPGFKSRRFSTHAELNAWKASVLRQLAGTFPAK